MDNIQEYIENYYNRFCNYISSLADQLKVGTRSEWEYSTPYFVGGPNGTYTIRSPYFGKSEFRVESLSVGGANAQVVVSVDQHQNVFDFTGGYPTTEYSPFYGLVYNVPASSAPIPVLSEYYELSNSQNVLYILVSTTDNHAAGVNIVFRHKR